MSLLPASPTDDLVIIFEPPPIKLLSHVARGDLCKVAQRELRESGRICIKDVWLRNRHRIKGTRVQYAATISWLIRHNLLKLKRFTR